MMGNTAALTSSAVSDDRTVRLWDLPHLGRFRGDQVQEPASEPANRSTN